MLLTGQEVRWVDRMTHGLSMACALDQRAALERAGSDANRLKVRRLVEEVRRTPSDTTSLPARLGSHATDSTLLIHKHTYGV